jgi:NAD(P)-dependent dehydrogenase (short-subunit alcohol dehydrogenase family)
MTARTWKLGAAAVGGALVARAVVRQWRRYDLRDKVAVITGSSRGLGLVIARELVRHHAKVVICARDRGELERARADLLARGGRVLAVPVDVTNRVQIAQLVEIVHQHWGRIDVVINNAGVIQVGPMEVMTASDYEEAMQTHFWGPLHLVLAVLPEMRGRRDGRIVNITSIGGKLAVPHLLPYSVSKFALVGFSEGLRAELAKDGIAVTTVVPGLMRTGSVVQAMFKGQHEQEYAWFAASGTSYATIRCVSSALPVGSSRRYATATPRSRSRSRRSSPRSHAVSRPGSCSACSAGSRVRCRASAASGRAACVARTMQTCSRARRSGRGSSAQPSATTSAERSGTMRSRERGLWGSPAAAMDGAWRPSLISTRT